MPRTTDVDKVAFTGSHLTGQKIVQASAGNLKRVSLELGGKSPDIVFADADLDAAVPGAAMAVFANSGQICSAGTRLFVEQKVYDEFVERVAAFAKALQVGNGLDPETQIGPLVSDRAARPRDGLSRHRPRRKAREPVAGGERLTEGELRARATSCRRRCSPTCSDDMRIAREEIFGPVISAIPFTDIDEVVQRANATTSAWAAACGRATSARRTGWPRRSAPARSGSTATRRWTRRCRSAATR